MDDLRSPCINICRIQPDTGWCEGCKRTVEEIMAWPVASDAEKRSILKRLPDRAGKRAWWRR